MNAKERVYEQYERMKNSTRERKRGKHRHINKTKKINK